MTVKTSIFRFSDAIFRHLKKWGQHYYIVGLFSPLSPFHCPQNDLEWPFTLKFSLLRTALWEIIFKLTHLAYRRACFYHVTSRDPQNIWDPRKDCGSFVDAIHRRNLNKIGQHYSIVLLSRHRTPDSKTRDLEWPLCVKFCLASVCLELWSMAFEAWLLLDLYSECCRQTLNRIEQLRLRARFPCDSTAFWFSCSSVDFNWRFSLRTVHRVKLQRTFSYSTCFILSKYFHTGLFYFNLQSARIPYVWVSTQYTKCTHVPL